jgi:ATP-binding cassette, subfamily B, bacterial
MSDSKDALEAGGVTDSLSGLRRLYRAYWHYGAPERGRMIGFTSLLLLAQGIKLSVPWFTGRAVDAMQGSGGADYAEAAWNIGAIFVACLFAWSLHGPGRVIERFVATGIRRRFTDHIYAKVVGLKLSWHQNHHSGDTIARVERATHALFNFAQTQFVYLQNIVNLVGPIVALFVLSITTGAAALIGYLAIGIVLVRFDRTMIRLNRESNEAEHRFSAALVDCLGNIATITALRLQQATGRMLEHRLDAVFDPLRRSVVMTEAKWCTIDLLNTAIRCFLVVLYVWLAWRSNGAVTLGSAVMVFQYTQQAGGVVGTMASSYQDLVRYQTDFGAAAGLMALEETAREAGAARIDGIPEDWDEIELTDLSFTYTCSPGSLPARRAAALSDVALTIRRGERIALVGASGSGKSTLLRLLSGLYEPDRVFYRIDGEARPDLPHLADIAMLVPQDPELFESSIGRNITMGVEYSPAEIREACDISGFASVLDRLPAGLETGIAERGVNLSGGQKQRLALARGLLAAAGSSLILLDEPTSSLDAATEARVYGHLHAAFPRSALISAIHRLHLLPRFDRIILMAGGQIVDAGTLAQLLSRQPGFRALWQDYVGHIGVAAEVAA